MYNYYNILKEYYIKFINIIDIVFISKIKIIKNYIMNEIHHNFYEKYYRM